MTLALAVARVLSVANSIGLLAAGIAPLGPEIPTTPTYRPWADPTAEPTDVQDTMAAHRSTLLAALASTTGAKEKTTKHPGTSSSRQLEVSDMTKDRLRLTRVTPITVKPDVDKRNYLGLDLANGMKILVGSDLAAKFASAVLCVLAGSLNDPWPLQGIAHFTEHMMFMGSRNFPAENELYRFLQSHGGRRSATTSARSTCYRFRVRAEYLKQALTMFSDMIAYPLFLDDSANREIYAVDHEYQMNKKNVYRALLQVEKATANQSHPFSKFTVGTRDSLLAGAQRRNATLGEEARNFYNRFYFGENVNAVVFGREPLNELKALSTRLFSAIRRWPATNMSYEAASHAGAVKKINGLDCAEKIQFEQKNVHQDEDVVSTKNVVDDGHQPARSAIDAAQYGSNTSYNRQPQDLSDYGGDVGGNPLGGSLQKIVKIASSSNKRLLRFTFPVTETEGFYRSSPDMYITKVLFDAKSSGSLFHYLNTSLIASSVSGKTCFHGKRFAIYCINISLTQKGLDKIDEVVEAVFAYLAYHRSAGIQRYLFDEISRMRWFKFKFRKPLTIEEVADLAKNFRMIESWQHAISAHHIIDRFRPDLITALLSELNPDNCRLVITAPQFANCSFLHKNLLQIEPHYNLTYWEEPFSEGQRRRWSAAWSAAVNETDTNHTASKSMRYNFTVPNPNPFIPDKLSIHAAQPKFTEKPVLLKKTKDDRVRLWILQNAKSKVPKSTVYVTFLSDAVFLTREHQTKLKLISRVFFDSLSAELESVRKAGTNVDLNVVVGGLQLTVKGFNQKQPQILRDMLDRFWRLTIDEARLKRIKSRYEESIENTAEIHSLHLTAELRTRLLYPNFSESWSEQLDSLRSYTQEEVQMLLDSMRNRFISVIYTHGNVQERAAIEMFNAVAHFVPETSLTADDIVRNAQLSLEAGHIYHYAAVVPQQSTNTVEVYVEIGPRGNHASTRVAAEIFAKIVIPEAFTVLRTKEQLGYRITTRTTDRGNIVGFFINVETSLNVSYVEERIWHFLLVHTKSFLNDLDDKTFENFKQSSIYERTSASTAFDFGSSYWPDLYESCHLNRSLDETYSIKMLDKSDIIELYERTISDRRKLKALVIHIVRTASPEVSDGCIKDVDSEDHEIIHESIAAFQSRLTPQKTKLANLCKTVKEFKDSQKM